MSERVEDWLVRGMVESGFVRRYPQYAAILASLVSLDDPRVDVMAVSACGGRFYLHVNRGYFESHPLFLAGILLHEVHHAVLGHVTNAKFRGSAFPELMDLAMEISANEHIREPLPPHVSLDDYMQFGLRAGQSTLERYELLVAARERVAGAGAGDSAERVDDHAVGGWKPGVKERVGDAVAEARLARVAAQAVRDHGDRASPLVALLAGVQAGEELEFLDDVSRRPNKHVDWRRALRAFVAATRISSYTYTRPNRRFPTRVGEVPCRRRRVSIARTKRRILVGIDTSASMARKDLEEIARQLRTLREHADLFIAECDSRIQRVYPFERELHYVRGRGGTDFRPLFEPELLEEYRVNGVVYFTDGEGPYPGQPPAVPVLWVLTPSGSLGCEWGERVSLA